MELRLEVLLLLDQMLKMKQIQTQLYANSILHVFECVSIAPIDSVDDLEGGEAEREDEKGGGDNRPPSPGLPVDEGDKRGFSRAVRAAEVVPDGRLGSGRAIRLDKTNFEAVGTLAGF